jgi:hypothetical protein
MCYLVREKQAGAAEGSGTTLPPSLDRLRPRLIGAVAAALLGGLAVAAIVAPSTPSATLSVKESGAPAPITARTSAVPMTPVFEQCSLPLDDGVPSASDVVKAGLGHCDHAL